MMDRVRYPERRRAFKSLVIGPKDRRTIGASPEFIVNFLTDEQRADLQRFPSTRGKVLDHQIACRGIPHYDRTFRDRSGRTGYRRPDGSVGRTYACAATRLLLGPRQAALLSVGSSVRLASAVPCHAPQGRCSELMRRVKAKEQQGLGHE